MKTRIFLMIFLALAIFSCQKEKNNTATEQDVIFTANQLTPDVGLKSTLDWPCKTEIPTNAWVQINGADYYPALFTLEGKLYTQAFKLPVGNYSITNFVLYKENGSVEGIQSGDVVVFGTPLSTSTYAVYVSHPLAYSFAVEAFKKAEVAIDVLCFQDQNYSNFGFDWFQLTEIVIREQCFFGDFCVKHPADYTGSHYANQSTGLQIDMPAIFQIKVYKGTTLQNTFTNDVAIYPGDPNGPTWWGVGHPLCVEYADNLSITGEVFNLELWILVKQGNAFTFVKFNTWTFTDANMIPAGTDGVVDFVLGSCNFSGTDLQLPPWQNLPATANMTIVYPGTMNTYWDIKFNSYTPAGAYDLGPAGVWHGGWCGDKNHLISQGTFNANIYSSLYVTGWPAGMPFTLAQIAQVNWMLNHTEDFDIIVGHNYGGDGGTVQQAIWKLLNNITPTDPIAATMASAASTHGNFVPLPGQWAAVLIVKDNEPLVYQLLFVMVDP
jgi:hypothetical protein